MMRQRRYQRFTPMIPFAIGVLSLSIGSGGCATQRETLQVPPRPVEIDIRSVRDWITQNRPHLTDGIEAFFLDDWSQLDRHIRAIEIALPQLETIPEPDLSRKAILDGVISRLRDRTTSLRKAITNKEVDATSRLLAQIGLEIRTLSLTWEPISPKAAANPSE